MRKLPVCKSLLEGVVNLPFDIIIVGVNVNMNCNPVLVVVRETLSATSFRDIRGAPLRLRLICEKSLCSMGLNLEQYGG